MLFIVLYRENAKCHLRAKPVWCTKLLDGFPFQAHYTLESRRKSLISSVNSSETNGKSQFFSLFNGLGPRRTI